MTQSFPDRSERVIVQIPDMFVSFLTDAPRFNPNYRQVKAKSEAWISEFCSFDEKMSALIRRCDFSYFIAIAAPEAALAEYRTLCDWGNWVFPYDDMFDNGGLRDQPTAAALIMQSLMSPMRKQDAQETNVSREERLLIIEVHDTVWERIKKGSLDGVHRRFADAMADYCAGALMQVEDFSSHKVVSPEEMLERRQLSAGVSPLFSLVEYAHELHVPDYVFEHPAIREIERLGIDFVLITNDILSYRKEEEESVPHNMVAVARMSGLDAQEAFDYVGNMLDSRYERWEAAIREVPDWGEEIINKNVEKYVQGVADVVRANLYWSFKSERYLGKDGLVVRKTRCVHVLRSPEFLRNRSPLS
ncbi:isoprenoid synthase domain-containing protein [Nemania serpens]|nr:isoprenoid synthase domain-containing protein [Nemania serpens]